MVNWIPKITIGRYWGRVLLTITLKMGNATHSFSSANGKTVSYEYDYKYDAKNNRLSIKDFNDIEILALSEGAMEILQPMGVFPNGKPRYAYSIYRRADDGEIANILIRAGLLKPTISIEDIKEGEK